MADSSHVFCFLSSLSQAEAPHDPHSVGREDEARTHFGQLVGLLVDTRRSHARTARWLRRDHRCRRPRWPLEADPRSLTITPRAPAQKARSPPARAGRRLQVEPPCDPVGRHQLKDLVQGHGGLRSRHSTICGPPSARGQLGCPPPSAPGAQPRYLSTAEPRNAIARNNTFITALTMYRSMDW